MHWSCFFFLAQIVYWSLELVSHSFIRLLLRRVKWPGSIKEKNIRLIYPVLHQKGQNEWINIHYQSKITE